MWPFFTLNKTSTEKQGLIDTFDINFHSLSMKGISAKLQMLITNINGYDVHIYDIKKIFLYVPTVKKVWTTCILELTRIIIDRVDCDITDRKVLIVSALYQLKSTG